MKKTAAAPNPAEKTAGPGQFFDGARVRRFSRCIARQHEPMEQRGPRATGLGSCGHGTQGARATGHDSSIGHGPLVSCAKASRRLGFPLTRAPPCVSCRVAKALSEPRAPAVPPTRRTMAPRRSAAAKAKDFEQAVCCAGSLVEATDFAAKSAAQQRGSARSDKKKHVEEAVKCCLRDTFKGESDRVK